MHEEASTTSKISSSLVNISHNHLNAANITVAIVSTTPQPQALSVPSIAGSNSAPSLHELATCSSSSSVTQPYPVILPNQTTKIIINNNTQSKALDQTNMAIAAASNKANVIVSGVQSATSSEASAYQTTQLIIATSSAMPMNLDGPVLGSCKSTSIDGCEVTTLHSVPQPTISTLETATSIANSMTESSNGINNTANSSITDDFDITVQDLNNCSTDETEDDPATKKAAGIGLVLMNLVCFSGAFTLSNYYETIFNEAGSSMSPALSSIIVASIQCCGVFTATLLIESLGRKPLILVSAYLSALCLAVMGAYSLMKTVGVDLSPVKWIPVTSLSSLAFFAANGASPVPFVVIGEIFNQNVRGFLVSLCLITNWLMSFVLVLIFPFMMESLKMYGSLWVFTAIESILATVVLYVLPETKGIPIEKIIQTLAVK